MDYNGQPVWLILAEATECAALPERSGILFGVVRVKEYTSHTALTSDGKGGTNGKF